MLQSCSVGHQSIQRCRVDSQWFRIYSVSAATITPRPSSAKRNSFPAHIQYPHSVALSSASTVQVGTSYENLCARTLQRLGFINLIRTAGRGDRGIDLLGRWRPPLRLATPTDIRGIPVVIQCKAVARKPGPEMIRELQGAVAGAPSEWAGEDTVGVLCAKRQATAGVREAVVRSGKGLVWVMIQDLDEEEEGHVSRIIEGVTGKEEISDRKGRIKQVLWNEPVKRAVGDNVGVVVRYLPGKMGLESEVCLAWQGRIWEPEAEEERDHG